jgi:hypothetical protein
MVYGITVVPLFVISFFLKFDIGLSPAAANMVKKLQDKLASYDSKDEDIEVSASLELDETIEERLTAELKKDEEGNPIPGVYVKKPVVVKKSSVKRKNAFIIRCAMHARSKVGRLAPTRANELVYQRIILDYFDDIHLRLSDRDRCLAQSIAACFIVDKQWDLVDEILTFFKKKGSISETQ